MGVGWELDGIVKTYIVYTVRTYNGPNLKSENIYIYIIYIYVHGATAMMYPKYCQIEIYDVRMAYVVLYLPYSLL